MPGLGALTGAWVLAEIGDHHTRFPDAKGLTAYTGSAPVTRASGKKTAVLHRRVKNQRLAPTGYIWPFAAVTASPGARAHYDRRKKPLARGVRPAYVAGVAATAAAVWARPWRTPSWSGPAAALSSPQHLRKSGPNQRPAGKKPAPRDHNHHR